MENQQAAEATATRTRRTAYYIVAAPLKFESKAKLERFLTEQGGVPAGQVIMKGAPIEAETQQVFKIN